MNLSCNNNSILEVLTYIALHYLSLGPITPKVCFASSMQQMVWMVVLVVVVVYVTSVENQIV